MHPNPAFSWIDCAEMLDFVADHRFAHIFAASEAERFGPARAGDRARREPPVPRFAAQQYRGANREAVRSSSSMLGRNAYQSARFLRRPTKCRPGTMKQWRSKALRPRCRETSWVMLVDELSDAMERRYPPESPWNRANMTPGRFEALVKAIVGL
jgi:hypothetical protein